jgi:hypothetical protein
LLVSRQDFTEQVRDVGSISAPGVQQWSSKENLIEDFSNSGGSRLWNETKNARLLILVKDGFSLKGVGSKLGVN